MAHKYMNVLSVKKNGFNNLKTNNIMEKYEKQINGFILGFFIGGIVGIIVLSLVQKGLI